MRNSIINKKRIDIKKFYLIAVMTLMALTVSAQQKLTLSTYAGSNLEKVDGKECNVTVNRYLFHGWNTISLPFDVNESELSEALGGDFRLERLVGVESAGNNVVLNFQDCKASGIEANKPYILYFNGENANCRIAKTAIISNEASSLSFSDGIEVVTMAGAQKQTDGQGYYGILVKDNREAKFTAVTNENKGGFYATRCYVKLASGNGKTISTNHLAAGETTGISAITKVGNSVDVYTISGQKVASKANAAHLRNLQPGVYVINGQKVLVK